MSEAATVAHLKEDIDLLEDRKAMLMRDFNASNDLNDLVCASQTAREIFTLKRYYNKARRRIARLAAATSAVRGRYDSQGHI